MHGMQKGGKLQIINLIKMSAADWLNAEKCQKNRRKMIFSVFLLLRFLIPGPCFLSLPNFVAMGNGELARIEITGSFHYRRHIGSEI